MKKSRLQPVLILIAGFLLLGSQIAMAKIVKVNVGGINYNLDSESMTATVIGTKGVSGDVSLPESVSYDGKTYALTSIGEEAFVECKEITSVSIPSGVTFIGKHAFLDCENLASVNVPSGVSSIEEGAFEQCFRLASIDLPSSVKYIGHHAFYVCQSLTSVTIPEGVDSIAARAFGECYKLSSVEFPSSLTVIGDEAFISCALTSVTIPFGVKSIGEQAFYWNDIASVSIPSSVTSIGGEAFYWCENLTSVTIPSSVTFIGEGAFGKCSALESIVVEDGNKVYDSRDNCNAIIETATNKLVQACQTSTIPYGVAVIGEFAFFALFDIPSITIPSSVTSIEDGAFYYCMSLKDVYCYGLEMIEDCADEAFLCINEDATLHVDASLVDKYKTTSPWNTSFTNIVALDGETGIGNISNGVQDTYRVYSVDGKELPSMQKGINILRSKNGKSVKVAR